MQHLCPRLVTAILWLTTSIRCGSGSRSIGARRGPARCGSAVLASVTLAVGGLGAIAIGPAGAGTASNESTFRAAWTNPGETRIDLAGDVTLTCPGGVAVRHVAGANAIAVDGHGHTITQTCARQNVLEQDGSGTLDFVNLKIVGSDSSSPGGNGVSVTANNSANENNSTIVINGGSDFAGDGVTSINSTNLANGTQIGSGDGIFIQSSGGNVNTGANVTITHSTNKPPRPSRGRRGHRRDRADRRSDDQALSQRPGRGASVQGTG